MERRVLAEQRTQLDFYAYYPYDAAATNPLAISFNVSADQSGATGVKAKAALDLGAVDPTPGSGVTVPATDNDPVSAFSDFGFRVAFP